mmetsp:Transcript_3478/g.5902  ORF Transcript_3478/g.5902 Transcript_3478/m.5902 type:complete len:322 (+) Transcript_3478:2805-3770(+)
MELLLELVREPPFPLHGHAFLQEHAVDILAVTASFVRVHYAAGQSWRRQTGQRRRILGGGEGSQTAGVIQDFLDDLYDGGQVTTLVGVADQFGGATKTFLDMATQKGLDEFLGGLVQRTDGQLLFADFTEQLAVNHYAFAAQGFEVFAEHDTGVVAFGHENLRLGQSEVATPRQEECGFAFTKDQLGDVDQALEGATTGERGGAIAGGFSAVSVEAPANFDMDRSGIFVGQTKRVLEGTDLIGFGAGKLLIAMGNDTLDELAVNTLQSVDFVAEEVDAVLALQCVNVLGAEMGRIGHLDQAVVQVNDGGAGATRTRAETQK